MIDDMYSSHYRGTAAGLGAAILLIIASILMSGCAPSSGQPGGGTLPPAVAPAGAANPVSQTTRISVDGGAYLDVGAAGLAAMLKSKDFPLINVHIPYEGEIEPTDSFIPYNEMDANLAKLPQDKAAKIVLYCRSGSMSATAARVLVKQGYTNVYNLDGGFIGWQQAGYPVAHKAR